MPAGSFGGASGGGTLAEIGEVVSDGTTSAIALPLQDGFVNIVEYECYPGTTNPARPYGHLSGDGGVTALDSGVAGYTTSLARMYSPTV